ncbi:putative sodium/metabolite cotransporter BASS4, chloroplastic [Tetrabaena socialis]|uniref:Putative sodium/metabolite cotransporter BASS4, chloroplastic n=1 Tax=Tetrabaena socialis TaxID=47790 RepID=A0A2J7ZZU4_9CHLO|nr:putative sodium/metabolite cotransporter BASS4, chloroplastic [Tetrabaena socialis]|eukprot:PNH05789.1 putative sodium/metabolite cotransporter BASS4, chloroplastic [Tetrabaena socialis]
MPQRLQRRSRHHRRYGSSGWSEYSEQKWVPGAGPLQPGFGSQDFTRPVTCRTFVVENYLPLAFAVALTWALAWPVPGRFLVRIVVAGNVHIIQAAVARAAMASQKSAPVAVTVISYVTSDPAQQGLLAIPAIVGQLSQIFIGAALAKVVAPAVVRDTKAREAAAKEVKEAKEAAAAAAAGPGPDAPPDAVALAPRSTPQSKREREPSFSPLDSLDLDGDAPFLKPRTIIPYRQLRTYEFIGIACPTPRTPTTRALWQLLAAAIIVLVLLQALSCGLFFCVALPVGRASYIDLREVFTEFRLFNQPQPELMSRAADAAPMLIPRILHQTYRTRQMPSTLRTVMQSWGRVNGQAWQARFYDDEACIDFVRREFPEYMDAYQALPKDVERSDFFSDPNESYRGRPMPPAAAHPPPPPSRAPPPPPPAAAAVPAPAAAAAAEDANMASGLLEERLIRDCTSCCSRGRLPLARAVPAVPVPYPLYPPPLLYPPPPPPPLLCPPPAAAAAAVAGGAWCAVGDWWRRSVRLCRRDKDGGTTGACAGAWNAQLLPLPPPPPIRTPLLPPPPPPPSCDDVAADVPPAAAVVPTERGGDACRTVPPTEPPAYSTGGGLTIFCLVPTTLGIGIALVRSCKGNEAIALLMTVGTNMLGVLVMPPYLRLLFLNFDAGISLNVSIPDLLLKLSLTILVPSVLGKGLRELWKPAEEFAKTHRTFLSLASTTSLACIVWQTLSGARDLLFEQRASMIVSVIVLSAAIHVFYLIINHYFVRWAAGGWAVVWLAGGWPSLAFPYVRQPTPSASGAFPTSPKDAGCPPHNHPDELARASPTSLTGSPARHLAAISSQHLAALAFPC